MNIAQNALLTAYFIIVGLTETLLKSSTALSTIVKKIMNANTHSHICPLKETILRYFIATNQPSTDYNFHILDDKISFNILEKVHTRHKSMERRNEP